jgi:hypothetical protein
MNRILISLIVLISIVLTNCATIVNGTKQQVTFYSTPSKANVVVDGASVGMTPMFLELTRKSDHFVKIQIDGYIPYEIKLTKKVDAIIIGNILIGGLIGIIIDASTGAMYKLTPKDINPVLEKSFSANHQKNKDIYIAVTLNPDPNWEKIGTLQRANN